MLACACVCIITVCVCARTCVVRLFVFIYNWSSKFSSNWAVVMESLIVQTKMFSMRPPACMCAHKCWSVNEMFCSFSTFPFVEIEKESTYRRVELKDDDRCTGKESACVHACTGTASLGKLRGHGRMGQRRLKVLLSFAFVSFFLSYSPASFHHWLF